MSSIRKSLQRPETPVQTDDDKEQSTEDRQTPPTPLSVIRHPLFESPEPPSVDDAQATVKASGMELRTKPSLTPADVETMAATRRKVSGEEPTVPPIREQDREDEATFVFEKSMVDDDTLLAPQPSSEETEQPQQACSEKRQSSLVKLDIPVDTIEGLGFGLDEEFDRVIEAQKVAFEQSLAHLSHSPTRVPLFQDLFPCNSSDKMNAADTAVIKQKGYLMRQNTKVVVASSRENQSSTEAGNDPNDNALHANQVEVSPRKASQPTWTIEPWNGKSRRQSIKVAGAITRKKVAGEPVPPLPGQESNVKDIEQQEVGASPVDDFEEGQERGRLFVKVVGVKNLDLPLPRSESSLRTALAFATNRRYRRTFTFFIDS
jgi:hypothetical protein